MTYPGSDLKFKITSIQKGFSFTENKFDITVKNKWGQKKYFVSRDDCFFDSDGNCYFTLENVKKGTLIAHFAGSISDDDYDKQEQVFTDEQELVKVGICDCKPTVNTCTCVHVISYEQVYTVSVDGDEYLADVYGRYIYTSDGMRIKFRSSITHKIEDMPKIELSMTGDEFKRLVEQYDENGKIDTIPEVFKFLKDVDDDTLGQYVKKIVDETQVKAVVGEEGVVRLIFPDDTNNQSQNTE